MTPVRRAVIDVGTNSVKLLVADVDGQSVEPVIEESKQTRLGSGFYETRQLQAGAIQQTAAAVAAFAESARARKAASIRVIATSAARDAVNANDLTDAIRSASGLSTEIITGEQEAEWVFQGVTTDSHLTSRPLLLLDVGGGSTEFIVGRGGRKHFRASFPLGTVRLMEKIPHSDPPTADELGTCQDWLKEFLGNEVAPQLVPALKREAEQDAGTDRAQLVGTGGTASILGRMEARLDRFDRELIEGTRLTLDRVRWHSSHLWKLPLQARQQTVGLPRTRADIILTGVAIYEAVMEQFGFDDLCVSTRGLRFAAVLDGPA